MIHHRGLFFFIVSFLSLCASLDARRKTITKLEFITLSKDNFTLLFQQAFENAKGNLNSLLKTGNKCFEKNRCRESHYMGIVLKLHLFNAMRESTLFKHDQQVNWHAIFEDIVSPLKEDEEAIPVWTDDGYKTFYSLVINELQLNTLGIKVPAKRENNSFFKRIWGKKKDISSLDDLAFKMQMLVFKTQMTENSLDDYPLFISPDASKKISTLNNESSREISTMEKKLSSSLKVNGLYGAKPVVDMHTNLFKTAGVKK